MAITYTFTPPVAKIVPPFLPETRGLQYLLFRYMPTRERGVNVYCLSDGTFAQDYPTPENQNTNFPLPYNPTEPNAPYVQWNDINGNLYFKTLPVRIENIFLGGHVYEIDEAMATKLSDAGYGDRIVANPPCTLTAATGATAITSLSITPSPGAFPIGTVVTLVGYPNTGNPSFTQNVILSAPVSINDTTLSVNSFVPTANFPVGTQVYL